MQIINKYSSLEMIHCSTNEKYLKWQTSCFNITIMFFMKKSVITEPDGQQIETSYTYIPLNSPHSF